MTGAAAGIDIESLAVVASDGDRTFRLEIDRLALGAGEVVGFTGASGTGKTMLLEVLGLLRRPAAGGRFMLSGAEEADVAAMWAAGRARSQAPALRGALFGFVPQTGGLLPFLTVAENIAVSQRIAGRHDAAWLAALEARLGLSGVRDLRPAALSIGQRQRVAIARALAHRPPFLIADEPTAALDPENAAAAMGLLIDAAAEGGAAVMVSSHDHGLLDRFPMRRLRLEAAPGGDREVRSRLAGALEAAA